MNKRAVNALKIVCLIASQPASQTLSTSRLSEELELSVSYLESLLSELKAHGLLHAYKGPGGGYQMGCEPEKITVWEVLQIFEEAAPARKPGKAVGSDYLDELERAFEAQQAEFLQSKTIDQLLQSDLPQRSPRVKTAGQFRLKPLPPKLMPHAANSVFQLHAYPALRAA